MAEETDVLEFGLDDERYCVAISYVAEIVGRDELTSVPNTADHVLGVMDLRGASLQVWDPKGPFGVDGDPGGERVVVLREDVGPEDTRVGWLVDSVHDVLTVSRDDVDEDVEGPGVYGALRPGDRMVIWVDPTEVLS